MAGWGLQVTAMEGGCLTWQYISETRWSFYWAKCVFYYSLWMEQISSAIIWFPHNGRKPSWPLRSQCVRKIFLQHVTHQLTTGQKACYRFVALLLPVAETAHLWHVKYCLGMLSTLVKVWEAQCPAVVPFPHIQQSAGIHFTKENTEQGSKWALQ